MIIRYAGNKDLDFIIEGLEKNRIIENRPQDQVKATDADKQEMQTAIDQDLIRVIEGDEKAVAFLYFRADFKLLYIKTPFFWVDLIYVDEHYRGQGLGKMLYEDAVKIAKDKGFDTIIIDIFAANQNSLGFHQKLGFEPLYTIYSKKI